jgi:peptide/nickel transport system permease protein
MLRVAGRRLLVAIPLVVFVSFVVFVLIDLAPGDPTNSLAGQNPTPALRAQIRQSLHLDQPLLVRYWRWLSDAVRGNLGKSFVSNLPVRSVLGSRVAVTFSLTLLALAMTIVFGGIGGILGALRPRGIIDRVVTVLSSIAIAIPPFWLGLVLVLVLAVQHHELPSLGYVGFGTDPWQWLRHLVLPAFALSAFGTAELALQLKGSLTDTLGRDFLLAGRAKGLSRSSLVLKHGLKNAAVPVITVLGFRLAQLLGGTVIIEVVFTLPGLGTLALDSTLNHDVPVMLGLVVIATLVVTLINVAVDVSYAYFNPRMRS